MGDVKLVNKIKRQSTLMENEIKDMYDYDRIVAMEWDGIPALSGKEYCVEYIETAGRDIIQQSTNVYAISRPKWDVFPRGAGDVDAAEEMERTIEWFFKKAAAEGRRPYYAEGMTHIGKYNKVCSQLEWQNEYGFCVKNYHPGTIRYEYGSRLHWIAVVDVVSAVSVIEKWDEFSDESRTEGARTKKSGGIYDADKIGAALKKVQKLIDDDESQMMMYVDYTDNKRRFTYCYPWNQANADEELGYSDSGEPVDGMVEIQDKPNSLGFINFVVTENEGDPLLAPLLKGKYYDNMNDLMTVQATSIFRSGISPVLLQEGNPDADIDIDHSGDQIVAKAPYGTRISPLNPPPLNPAYEMLLAQMRQRMSNSLGVQNVSQAQVSNVQHATYDAQVKMWLLQFEPNKRTAERHYVSLAKLMLMWAKKKNVVLKATRMYSKPDGKPKGQQILIDPEVIDLDSLYIQCKILANNPTDVLQLVNQISMLKQSGVRIPDTEFVEQLDMGDPEMLGELYEAQEVRTATLQSAVKTIVQEADQIMAQFQMQLQMQMAEFQAGMQQQMQQAQMAQQAQTQQTQGATAPEGGSPLPSDQAMSGQGFNAGQGGMAPQAANPEITQAQR